MSNELQVILERDVLGKDFKLYGDYDNPLFLAKDVAIWIEHSNSRAMIELVDAREKTKKLCPVNNPYGGYQEEEQWFLTEDGLYEVLMQSRKPIAKEFKKQVKQILKDVRRHGMYATPQKLEDMLNDPDSMIVTLQALKAEREKVAALREKAVEDKPKVIFAQAVEAAKTSILIGDLAKLLKQNAIETGQNRLFEWLRQNDYLMKQGSSRNMPTQKSMEQGLFEIKESTIVNPDGSIRVTKTTKVTGKGQIYFINLFCQQRVAI